MNNTCKLSSSWRSYNRNTIIYTNNIDLKWRGKTSKLINWRHKYNNWTKKMKNYIRTLECSISILKEYKWIKLKLNGPNSIRVPIRVVFNSKRINLLLRFHLRAIMTQRLFSEKSLKIQQLNWNLTCRNKTSYIRDNELNYILN